MEYYIRVGNKKKAKKASFVKIQNNKDVLQLKKTKYKKLFKLIIIILIK